MRRFHALAVAALAAMACACGPSPRGDGKGEPVAADTKFFTVLARDRIQVARNAKVSQVLDADGMPLGYAIMARDNDSGFITCGCLSACMEKASDRCREVRIDNPAFTTISCAGGCIGSEGKPCGGCSMRVHDEPPAGGHLATVAEASGDAAQPREAPRGD